VKRLQKFRKGCRWALTLGLIVLLLLCLLVIFLLIRVHVSAAAAQQAWDVMVLLDQSNSMTGADGQGSDPETLRAEAAGLIITALGVEAQQHDHRLGIVHFGTESWLASPLTSLRNPTDREMLRRALVAAEPMGWTDPLKALEVAYAQLYPEPERLHAAQEDSIYRTGNRRQAIVLITDGKPELPTLTTAAQKTAYAEALRALVVRFQAQQCAIFTIAISAGAIAPDKDMPTFYRNLWQEIAASAPPGIYYEIHTVDDLPQVYHSIAAQLLGVEPRQPEIADIIQGAVENELWVEAGLQRVTFVIFKREPPVSVQLHRPGGALVRDDDPDVQHLGGGPQSSDEMWAIEQPREGRWTVSLQGGGQVMIWKDVLLADAAPAEPFVLDVQAPRYVATTQPLTFSVAIRNVDGERINNAGIQVTVELRRAGFGEVALLLHHTTEGSYWGEAQNLSPGTYTALARALLAGREVGHHEMAVSIVALPHLVVNAPEPGEQITTSESLTVAMQVRAGWMLLDAPTLARLGTLTATLHGPEGFAQSVSLHIRADHTFVAHPQIPTHPGVYTLTLQLSGATFEGLPFAEEHALRLSVVELPQTRTLPRWPLWLVAGGSAVGLTSWRVYLRRPALEGQWRVLHAPETQRSGGVIPIPAARRAVLIGGRQTHTAPVVALRSVPSSIARLHPARDRNGTVEVWLTPLTEATIPLLYNDYPITTPQRLHDGDVIDASGYRLRYENVQQAAARRQYVGQTAEKMEWLA